MSRKKPIDAIDHVILSALRADGRLRLQQLSDLVGLVPSAIADRIRRLQDDGVLLGFTAIIDGRQIGLIDHVTRLQLQAERPALRLEFEQTICTNDKIASAKRLLGANGYLLRGYGTQFIDAVYQTAERSGVRIEAISNDAIDLEIKPLRGAPLPPFS